jgi:hypothetical protein
MPPLVENTEDPDVLPSAEARLRWARLEEGRWPLKIRREAGLSQRRAKDFTYLLPAFRQREARSESQNMSDPSNDKPNKMLRSFDYEEKEKRQHQGGKYFKRRVEQYGSELG